MARPFRWRISCADIVNDRTPPELDQLTEEQKQIFLNDVEEFFGEGACDNFQAVDEFRKGFTLPDSITRSNRGTSRPLGPLLIMVLAASVMGSEYGWGTLRNVLTRGTGPLAAPLRKAPSAPAAVLRRAHHPSRLCRRLQLHRRCHPTETRRVNWPTPGEWLDIVVEHT